MAADTLAADAPVHARATVRPDKAETVAELTSAFRDANAAVLTEYRGLSVKQVTALRVALGTDTTYSVVKNTLTKLAAAEAGLDGLTDLLAGPTAVAFVNGDPVEAAKSLRDFGRANPALVIKGGVLDGKALTAAEIAKLADLESREVLLAKLAGAMLATLTQAAYAFNALPTKTAQLAAALAAKAADDPSVIGGAGEAPAAEAAAPAAEEVTEEITEEVAAEAAAEPADDAPADDAPAEDSTPDSTEASTETA
jgi:large subunit ribosomal protein L10